MPQGKGTYGSKRGRPKKYQDGGSIDPFSSKNPESIVSKKALQELAEQSAMEQSAMEQSGFPMSNAQERSQASPMGNEVGTGIYKGQG
jgi:hypothetical protein